MAKRCANPDSDDETPYSVHGAPASKRAHIAESDEEARASKSKGKARRRDEDYSEEEEDNDQESGEAGAADEGEPEHELEARILASLQSKRTVQGGIADHGIIETIEMHQFMCHKFLTFSFGPQLNFIIGHNGSGKSAVLSAITIALGGKANSTGRGNGLKSFIREGQAAAEVTIVLKNQGEEAYKPKEYGKSIMITRRFTREGSSSWKIKSKDGKVVSTKKDELAAICDHMNIQVDNPMNIFTQDAARQFLSASTPLDKYKFFLRGTQLSQLSEEYDTCFTNITAVAKALLQKKDAITDLKTAFRAASARFEEASKAREQKKKVDELKKELAWAHINEKEKELEAKMADVAKMSRRLPRIQTNLEDAQVALTAADETAVTLEHEHNALGEREELQEKKNEVLAEIREKKQKIAELHEQLKGINSNLKSTKKQIEEYTSTIQKETERLEKAFESKREETQQKMEGARAAVTAAENAFKAILAQKASAEAELSRLKEAGAAAESTRNDLRNSITACDNNIQNCLKADKDRYAAYGNNIQRVVQEINKTDWHGQKPLGPFGIHVRVRDNRWAELLRFMLAGLLSSFAVTDARDTRTLKKILADNNNPTTSVHFFTPDLFDYSHGEPPADILTVLRVLEVSDPHVLRIMINKGSIESRILALKRADAQRILATMRSGSAWTLDGFNVTRYPEGGESSIPIHPRQMHSMLLVGSATNELERWREKKAGHEGELQGANAALNAAQGKWNEAKKALEILNRQAKRADDAIHEARLVVCQLQSEINDEMPDHLSAIQEALKASSKAENDIMTDQFTEISRQKAVFDGEQKELVAKRDKLQEEINDFTNIKDAAREKIEMAVANRTKLASDVNHWKKKLAEEEAKIQEAEKVAVDVQAQFTEWSAKAEEYCARVRTNKSSEELKRTLESKQAALQEREKRHVWHGASVEEMTVEVNKAKERLSKAEKDLNQMTKLNKALKASLIVRLSRWQEFCRHIALRCKLVFGYHLSQRGYYGKVLFDHEEGTLQLKVQTDDQAATQGARDKDPRSLSGGEKSFSTICLLLSLWESIGCPLRCLDEFDVFMDAVNRRISMKMMIDTANSSDKKQYVFITPQDMNNVAIGPTVRVHRMTDPERGQGVLGFAS